MSVYKIYDILYSVVVMKLFFSVLLVFLMLGCQTIEDKAEKIGNKRLKK